MAKIMDFEEYRTLVDEVKVHDYKYFSLNDPTISDEEYDAHRHNSVYGVREVLAPTMRHNPLVHVVSHYILSSGAADGRSACRSRRFTVFCHSL